MIYDVLNFLRTNIDWNVLDFVIEIHNNERTGLWKCAVVRHNVHQMKATNVVNSMILFCEHMKNCGDFGDSILSEWEKVKE